MGITDTNPGGEGGTSSVSAPFDQDGFAWQLGAGFNYEVARGVDVGLGYRYFNGPKLRGFEVNNGGEAGVDPRIATDDNENHSVQANITVKID